jgi:hypothetical protein
MKEKQFSHIIAAGVLVVFMVFSLVTCITFSKQGLFGYDTYNGESEPLFADTTWAYQFYRRNFSDPGEPQSVEFLPGGELVAPKIWGSKLWTWERIGTRVRIKDGDGRYYMEATYYPDTKNIRGEGSRAEGTWYWIMQLKSGDLSGYLPPPPQKNEPIIRKPVITSKELTQLELAYAYNQTYRDIEAQGRRLKISSMSERNQFIQQYNGSPDVPQVFNATNWELEYFNSTTISAGEIVTRAKNESNKFRRVRLIHDWVADIFAYDKALLLWMDVNHRNAEFTLQQIIQREKGVCLEYAVLFWYLADTAGLDVYLISDHSKPGVGHAYNMVVINGTGYIIDTTWDSGNVSDVDGKITFQRHFEKNYFMPSIFQSYVRRSW